MPVNVVGQTIDQLSREKGIDPEIVIAALEDAMAVAARKHYKTTEEVRAEFDRATGVLRVFAVRKVVEEVTDPLLEVTLAEARLVDPRWKWAAKSGCPGRPTNWGGLPRKR